MDSPLPATPVMAQRSGNNNYYDEMHAGAEAVGEMLSKISTFMLLYIHYVLNLVCFFLVAHLKRV